MKQAVMYGGGNIGRGFIGALFSDSGFRVTFVDVAQPLVRQLQADGRYPIRYVSDTGNRDIWVENVTAVSGLDQDAVARAIDGCNIMATAVGVRILERIVPNLVAGLRLRWAHGRDPLNIIICENLAGADKFLADKIKVLLTDEELPLFEETVGLVEASIGRMVPIQTEEMKDGNPLRICTELYGFLPVDKAAFKGSIPDIRNLVPYTPFDFYLQRKLYIHNMGHALCAYLGEPSGFRYICDAIVDPDIYILTKNAMLESARALSLAHHTPLDAILRHIDDLLHRFSNSALGDTCQRVGADPARKLGPQDRLIGAARLALSQNITPANIAVGIAAGLRRYLQEQALPQTWQNAAGTLKQLSDVDAKEPLGELVLTVFNLLLQEATPGQLWKAAVNLQSVNDRNVV